MNILHNWDKCFGMLTDGDNHIVSSALFFKLVDKYGKTSVSFRLNKNMEYVVIDPEYKKLIRELYNFDLCYDCFRGMVETVVL